MTETPPQKLQKKQSAYEFFNPTNDSPVAKSMPISSPQRNVGKSPSPGKKPHLINVKGLSSLYTSTNLSIDESNALLVWAHVRPLLSRSDALPETVQGIKEASKAWRDLLSSTNNDNFLKLKNGGKMVDENCPYSVSRSNGTISSDGTILDIPCGLVEDSSVTVVGIPDGRNGTFQIEIVGSQLSGEPEAPIILQYSVFLPGDNMTEEPFIVQNSWSSESGWGKEERCPAVGSANQRKGISQNHFFRHTFSMEGSFKS